MVSYCGVNSSTQQQPITLVLTRWKATQSVFRFPGIVTPRHWQSGQRAVLASPGSMPSWPSSGRKAGSTILPDMQWLVSWPEGTYGSAGRRAWRYTDISHMEIQLNCIEYFFITHIIQHVHLLTFLFSKFLPPFPNLAMKRFFCLLDIFIPYLQTSKGLDFLKQNWHDVFVFALHVCVCRCLRSYCWMQTGVWMQAAGCGFPAALSSSSSFTAIALWVSVGVQILMETTYGTLTPTQDCYVLFL